MKTRHLIAGFSLLLAAGCTILNEPDRSLIQGDVMTDAGSDSGRGSHTDTGIGDAGSDATIAMPQDCCVSEGGDVEPWFDGGSDGGWQVAPDAGSDAGSDGAVTLVPQGEVCDSGTDDDGNGLTDCADFACASFPGCCVSGTPDFDESWQSGFEEDWKLVPSTGQASLPRVERNWIVEFLGDGGPSGLIRRTCTPMALGVEIQARLRPAGLPASDAGVSAHSYAGVVLTAALDTLPGKPLADDLAVVVDQQGYVYVTRAGASLAHSEQSYPADHKLLVTITVTPAADASATLLAKVTVQDEDGSVEAEEVLIDGQGFITRSALVRDVEGCREVDGLLVAIEGEGDGVQVGQVTATTKQCINPSQFLDPPQSEADQLSAVKLGYGSWASGYIGAPALIHNPIPGDIARWDLMVEASNAAPELETWTYVGYALGHAYAVDWNALAWSGLTGTIAGNDPPSCIGEGAFCVQGASLREPGIYGVLTGSGILDDLRVVYARAEVHTPDVYSLYGADLGLTPSALSASEKLAPDHPELDACASLRDPHIVPRGTNIQNDGFWLFFTCESSGGQRSIWVTRLNQSLTVSNQAGFAEVLDGADLGPYAAGGVWGPEVVITRDPDSNQTLFRMWFMARSRMDSAPVIGMAQGQASGTKRPAEFVPYAANPVLTAESEALGGPCDGFCMLKGLAVAPIGNTSRLRLLVARRLLGQNISESQLIPLDQYWSSPWE